ncbi:SKI/DACH domain-containing protein 1-like [Brienomyrus brachyistius]|uniref:SKI/DACH domain-containing protein 1-like n=1 Tax=Brienomyrus brachyistius TaxID=42636 RepID=UPI0020B1E9E8|nr:SKI/DACH domain-containing protein 1-like [Brienomyrus brachyistius]
MGDLESGFEEMEGVKLGYLVIKGKQMFALSQVFTDLLKNIPRTTVHKRMDHLNVKKHHCDLEELRKLKAINSIAFHAAKCTLISREDVEALYISCKTERVLKSKRSKLKTKSAEDLYDGHIRSDPQNTFWKEKVWLSLHGVSQPFTFKNKAGRQHETVSPQASNLPQIYSKFASHGFHADAKSACRSPKNFETAQIPSNCVAFNPGHSFFRSVVCSRQPVLYQSAIAVQSKLASTADLTYKRKRQYDGAGWHFWNKSRHSRRLLLVPKCCKSKVSNGHLNKFHIDRELYLAHQNVGNFQESCSSDTESSTYSERADNDSDFGSSLSTTSNSGTSDDEEDDSLSESSDVSSEDDSSSESDSSSVSSQVSLQSIRYRRTSFSTLNNKAPLVTQATFLYDQHRPKNQSATTLLDYGISNRKLPKSDFKLCGKKQEVGSASKQSKICPLVPGTSLPESKRETAPGITFSNFEIPDDRKRLEPTINRVQEEGHSPCLKENKDFPQQRVSGQSNKCHQALISHCAQDKETIVSQSSENNPSLAVNLKKEAKISHCLKPHAYLTIKAEPEDHNTLSNYQGENSTVPRTSPTLPQNVKIKVEENFDEYEYSCQIPEFGPEHHCDGKDPDVTNLQHPCGEEKPSENLNHASKATECTDDPATSQKSPSRNQEFKSTLNTPYADEGEYKNGARVRKNYRTLVLGKQTGIARTPLKLNVKADRNPRSTGKPEHYEGSAEDCTGATKRKRASSNVAAVKKPFSFMANFPSPPSLIIGNDGDLCPAYSLKPMKDNMSPHRSHPVWKWQLGGSAVPLPPSHRFRKF